MRRPALLEFTCTGAGNNPKNLALPPWGGAGTSREEDSGLALRLRPGTGAHVVPEQIPRTIHGSSVCFFPSFSFSWRAFLPFLPPVRSCRASRYCFARQPNLQKKNLPASSIPRHVLALIVPSQLQKWHVYVAAGPPTETCGTRR
jgi:hypothetical protein